MTIRTLAAFMAALLILLAACGPQGRVDVHALAVTGYELIDAIADTAVGPLQDGDVLDVNALPASVSVNVLAPTGTLYLELLVDGVSQGIQTENNAPFALYGNNGGDYHGQPWGVGSYELRVTGASTATINFVVEDPAPPPPPPPPSGGGDRLLTEFWFPVDANGHAGAAIDGSTGQKFIYTPNGAVDGVGLDNGWTMADVPAAYETFDHLLVPHVAKRNPETTITLARDALVVVAPVLDTSKPSWMSASWAAGPSFVFTKGSTTKTPASYSQVLAAGTHTLGEPNSSNGFSFEILLGEADGTPSAYPTAPAGQTQPTPNAVCPAWVHDQYAHYHPQFNPEYWCHFDHEHGSDPALFEGLSSVDASFGQVMTSENHNGYKFFVNEIEAGSDGRQVRVMYLLHMGSSGYGRACGRWHTLHEWGWDANTNELLWAFKYRADFGASRVAEDAVTRYPVYPPGCPTQYADAAADGSTGYRNISLYPGGGYEAWQQDVGTAAALPHHRDESAQQVFSTDGIGVMSECTRSTSGAYPSPGYTCDGLVLLSKPGAARWQTTRGMGIDTVSAGTNSGVFCTDPEARVVVACTDPDALEQFAKPGVDTVMPTHMSTSFDVLSAPNVWGALYIAGNMARPSDRWLPAGFTPTEN